MITPWVREFLDAFEHWSPWFGIPWAGVELIGLAVIGTEFSWLNPVLVVTGYMGLFIGATFAIASSLTISILTQSERRNEP